MEKQRFDEIWPSHREGAAFCDGDKLVDIATERSGGWRLRSIFNGVVCYGGLLWALLSDEPSRVAAVLAAIAVIYAANVLTSLQQQATRIREELELLKGSARENRFTTIVRTQRDHE